MANSNYWNNAVAGTSIFSVGPIGDVNSPSHNYVAYAFAEVPGFSKFGSYTGNGSTDGPFVYTGFKPRYLLWKRTDTTSAWFIYDSVRQTNNVMGIEIYANLPDAESPTTRMDFLSNGFKLRAANGGDNASGGTYIFAAFAEAPFGGAGIAPATAR
jgi:hypothetical protein